MNQNIPVLTTKPPTMSRRLWRQTFAYRQDPTCNTCHQTTDRCPECGLPLPVRSPHLYCKKCNQDLKVKYIYDGPKYNTPILACPSCDAIDWWGDEDFNLDIE